MTIGIDCAFDLVTMTDFYSGSSGESVYLIASKILVRDESDGWWHLKEGSWVMTDKGYRLTEYLKDMKCYHIKPTEMMSGCMAGSESAKSRRISQPRSASERMVWKFRQWDIFNGTPVVMSEWVFMQFYKDVIGWIIKMQGPLADRTEPGTHVLCFLFFSELLQKPIMHIVTRPRVSLTHKWHVKVESLPALLLYLLETLDTLC